MKVLLREPDEPVEPRRRPRSDAADALQVIQRLKCPAFEPIGTIGRIDELKPLPDGRYLLNLIGLERVALGEVVRATPYRLVEFGVENGGFIHHGQNAIDQLGLRLIGLLARSQRRKTTNTDHTAT